MHTHAQSSLWPARASNNQKTRPGDNRLAQQQASHLSFSRAMRTFTEFCAQKRDWSARSSASLPLQQQRDSHATLRLPLAHWGHGDAETELLSQATQPSRPALGSLTCQGGAPLLHHARLSCAGRPHASGSERSGPGCF